MRTEVSVAARWWADTVREHISGAASELSLDLNARASAASHALLQSRVDTFLVELEKALLERYNGHWYREDPERGHAFRSIALDKFQLDPLLALAARRSKLSSRLVHVALLNCPLGELVMFVDPFCVSVQQRSPRVSHLLHQDTAKVEKHSPTATSPRGRSLSASEQLHMARQHFERTTRQPSRTFAGMAAASSSSDEEAEAVGVRSVNNLLFTVQRPRARAVA